MVLRRRLLFLTAFALSLVTAGLLTGCGGGRDSGVGVTVGEVTITATSSTEATSPGSTETPVTTPPASTQTTSSGPSTTLPPRGQVSVYFAYREKVLPAHRSAADPTEPAKAAMEALLRGPTAAEKSGGLSTSIPAGTKLLSLSISGSRATVDLSSEFQSGGGSQSMGMRVAQVVFTLTQFSQVRTVSFHIRGTPVTALGGEGVMLDQPVGRKDLAAFTPAILVESPAWGDTVRNSVHVWGTANVFEGVFTVQLTDWDGAIVAEERVKASSGTGTRGAFDVTVPFVADRSGRGSLIVFSKSPKDGSQADLVEIPLMVEK